MKYLTKMKITTVFFVILFLSCFFEATNPLDSAYQGSYNFENTDTLPSQLEVLKEYRIRYKDNGTDKYWKFYCSFNPPVDRSVVRSDSTTAFADTGSVGLVFKKVYTGKITLIAEQPNRTKAGRPLCKQDSVIHVKNPYSIEGPRLAGIGDSVFLSVLYKGENAKIAGSDEVIYKDNIHFLNDSIKVLYTFGTISSACQFRIKRNNVTFGNDTFDLPLYTISYPGYSPRIAQFSRNDSVSLKLGGKATFSVKLGSNSLSDSLIYKITSGTTVLSIDTLDYIGSDSIQVVTIDTLKDTLYSKIMLTVYKNYNKDSLTDTESLSSPNVLNVYPELPVISFRDSSTAVEKDSTFKVDIISVESLGKDSFYWSFQGVKDSVTTTPFMIIPPIRGASDTVSVYVKRVYNLGGKKFEYRSDTLTKVFHPMEFKYKIQPKFTDKNQIVAKCIDTFQVYVTTGGVPVPDTSLVYSWIFPPSIDTNFVKIIPKKPIGSGFILTVMDSVKLPKFYFSVNAKLKNGTDSTALLKREFIVRNYRPSLKLYQPLPATTLMQDVSFDVLDSNDAVNMVYYKFSDTIVSDDKSVKTAAPQSKKFILYFKRNGTATVKAWAIDASGFVSDTAVVKFDVKVITPQFPIKPDMVEATIGVAKTLHARLASPLDSITYIWDCNGNGIYNEENIDTTTKYSDSISFIPLDATPDTLFVQCQNKNGVSAPNPYTLIVVARKNEPVIDSLRVDPAAVYGNDNMKIKAVVSDRDSNLTNVKIYWSFNGSTDTLLCDSLVKAPFKKCSIDAIKKNNRYGTYKFTVIATDSRGNTSTSFVTHSLLKGDPVVDSVRVKPQLTYFVRKPVSVTIYAKDPNVDGRIDSIQFIKSNDSSVIVTRPWPDQKASYTLNDTINDTGSQYIRVRVIDDEGNRSTIASTISQIHVLPHTPRIDTIICTTTAAYYNKTVSFTIHAKDSCDSSLIYSVSYNDSLHFRPLSTDTFNFSSKTVGINSFFVKVTDPEGFSAIRKGTILILDGKPVFGSGINQQNDYWTNDTNSFTFVCSDPNGRVDKLEINWGDGTPVTPLQSTNSGDKFTFGTRKSFKNILKKDNTYRISLTFTDNDSMITTIVDSITIKQGKPTLRPSFGNDSTTIFGKYDPSDVRLPCVLSVHAADVNLKGSILNYYWFLSQDSSSLESANKSSPDSTFELTNIPTNLANTIYTTVTVIVMDDDSNLVAKKFNVYVDAPPPVPTIIRPNSGSTVFGANDTIYFEWYGLDKLDSMATNFEVSIAPAGTTTWTTIVPFSLASSANFSVTDINGVKHLTYKYRPAGLPLPSTYSYIWRIRSRDRCNSISTNESGSFSHN